MLASQPWSLVCGWDGDGGMSVEQSNKVGHSWENLKSLPSAGPKVKINTMVSLQLFAFLPKPKHSPGESKSHHWGLAEV